MSSREKGMARLLSRLSRAKRFDAVMEKISAGASTFLDLGCGNGALTSILTGTFPSALIVGVDRSKYLLHELQRKRIALTVLADISNLPFKKDFFDVAVAVQVLHEIMSLKGISAMIQTMENVRSLLRIGGEFIIFDHVNPGDALVLIKLSNPMLKKFREFQKKFKHRKITCQDQGEGLVNISMRDFYDFLTKIWALNSELEEEEMNETHTPFTRQELKDHLVKIGFKVEQISSFATVHPHKGIAVHSNVKLPERQIVLLARK
ncbi:methyltransferase domain-containing protein [Candidatus Bathyarchaeota archaeon]|nr:methyltransferase domain-containing protein [Candidatus Bathyarchaeota archaeon]